MLLKDFSSSEVLEEGKKKKHKKKSRLQKLHARTRSKRMPFYGGFWGWNGGYDNDNDSGDAGDGGGE